MRGIDSSRLPESGLVQRLRSAWLRLDAQAGTMVIVAYSGGADSLALLAALSILQRQDLLTIHAVHVDHGARDDSARDRAIAESRI